MPIGLQSPSQFCDTLTPWQVLPPFTPKLPLAHRLIRLLIGLPLYGIGCGFVVDAGLGVEPWTVLAQGLSIHTGIGIGWLTNIIGALILLLWIPLRERPGLGTVLNVLLVGTFLQFTVDTVPAPTGFLAQFVVVLAGIATVGLASGIYLGAGAGAGPRDGLMRGLARATKRPLWQARIAIEVTALAIGWSLGGSVGLGTVMFALLIGPAANLGVVLLRPRPGSPRQHGHPGRRRPGQPQIR